MPWEAGDERATDGAGDPAEDDMFACDKCVNRCVTTTALLRHQLWECRVAAEVREVAQNDVLCDRSGWPVCPELPRGTTFDHLGTLQRYLAGVAEKRDTVLFERMFYVERDPPWKLLKDGVRFPPPDAKEFMSVAKGQEVRKYARAMLGWLRRLKWPAEESDTGVTAIELATSSAAQVLALPADCTRRQRS
eukprot:TRINITY_DN187_c3_g1_i2.p1 TRINITY_DN187_c3_g1~~TRINITY_DN187_c3_g1_i2.p1  ORF type:complete len:191 (-),score=27.92 TRINITY_DN187_c3_g1_i2:273-845(-)